jgi:hypothetical protein
MRPSTRKRVKAVPPLEHVIHRLGDVGMPRAPGAFLSHPSFEVGDEWRDASAANGKTVVGRQTIDLALDIEDRVDALDRLEGERRDDGELAAHLGGYVASAKNLRRLCAQHAASVIGPARRSAA